MLLEIVGNIMSILSSIESFQYFYSLLDTAFVSIISSIIYLIFARLIERISKIKTRYTMKKFIAVLEILCIIVHFPLAGVGILDNNLILTVQVIILHRIPRGTATHGKRGTAEV